jgi:hypothetical protein
MKKRKAKIYEVGVPAEELWVYHVEAFTKKEAIAKAKRGVGFQVYTLSGNRLTCVLLGEKREDK